MRELNRRSAIARHARREIKERLKSGDASVGELLLEELPAALANRQPVLRIGELLAWERWMGARRARMFLLELRIDPQTPVARLTPINRRRIHRALVEREARNVVVRARRAKKIEVRSWAA